MLSIIILIVSFHRYRQDHHHHPVTTTTTTTTTTIIIIIISSSITTTIIINIGSLSNNDGDGYENVTQKVKPRCFKLHPAYSISFNSSNVGNFLWS